MLTRTPKALLFDLGGVLVDIDFNRALQDWAPYSALPIDHMRARFKFDRAYERHERGQIGAAEYFDHLARSLELSATHDEIERGWNRIFIAEIQTTRMLVQGRIAGMPCYIFSNTNASHHATWSRQFPEVVQAFDEIFVSHELGLRKPELAAFMRICELTRTPPADFLFFDDLAENVQAARDAGFEAIHVRSPRDVQEALQRVGALR